jgi:hypothetical protein
MRRKTVIIIVISILFTGIILFFSFYFCYLKKISIYNLINIELSGIAKQDYNLIHYNGITPLDKKIALSPYKIEEKGIRDIPGCFTNIELIIPNDIASKITEVRIILKKKKFVLKLNELENSSLSDTSKTYNLPDYVRSEDDLFKKLFAAYPFNILLAKLHFIMPYIIAYVIGNLLILLFLIISYGIKRVPKKNFKKYEVFFQKVYYLVFIIFIVFILDYFIGTIFLHIKGIPINNGNGIGVQHYLYHHDKYFHHGLRPMINLNENWGGIVDVSTNSLGFRDFYPKKIHAKTNKRRILFLGDSFTQGVGVPVEKTFYGLSSIIMESDSLEILNAACLSYSPKLYYLKLKYLLEIEKIDINDLYVFIDISDIQDELNYEDFEPGKSIERIKNNNSGNQFLNFISQNSAISIIYHSINEKYFPQEIMIKSEKITWGKYYSQRDKWTHSDTIFKMWGENGANLALSNMNKLIDLCNQRNLM